MICDEIQERAPLFLSGELTGAERARFVAHLDSCTACELEIEAQTLLDARISLALGAATPVTTLVENRVRRRIVWQRWTPVAAIAAGILVVAAGTYALLRPAPAPAWYAAAALDHHVEVIRGEPRRWRTDPAEIDKVVVQGGLSLAQSQELAAPGYALERARMCGLSGDRMVHLVFRNGEHRYSLYVSQHAGGRSRVRLVHSGSEDVAGFETGHLRAAVVMESASAECEDFARIAASKL